MGAFLNYNRFQPLVQNNQKWQAFETGCLVELLRRCYNGLKILAASQNRTR
jgi:hypothetical protein